MNRFQRALCLTGVLFLIEGCNSQTDRDHADTLPPTETQSTAATRPPNSAKASAESQARRGSGSLDRGLPAVTFTDVSAESGLAFRYYGSPSDQAYMTEQNAGGIAAFDYDNDYSPDLYLANGSHFTKPAHKPDHSSQLFRSKGGCKFENVTQKSGLEQFSFGMGVCAGDFNNDGFCDLFVACFNENSLFQNQGDGTFLKASSKAFPADNVWSCSPAFADLDGNGTLDIYVVNYVDWTSEVAPCNPPNAPHLRRTCSPTAFNAAADQLFANSGDGTFQEIGESAGICDKQDGKGLALAILDVNNDGQLDIYVANDATANSLFINQGSFSFLNEALRYGVAVSEDGVQGASMGVGVADFNRDGENDIFVTNFRNQVNDLFQSLGEAGFVFSNSSTGLDLASRSKLSFGTIFRDFNGDSLPDIFIANGHIWDLTSLGSQYDYKMQPSLMLNEHGRRFSDVSPEAGSYFRNEWLGRSATSADLDSDGDWDLVIQHLEADAVVLRNDTSKESNGVLVRFIGTSSCRDPLGCRVEYCRDGQTFVEHVPSGESFQASLDPRILIPGTEASKISAIRITWPNGKLEEWENIEIAELSQLVAIESGDVFKLPLH